MSSESSGAKAAKMIPGADKDVSVGHNRGSQLHLASSALPNAVLFAKAPHRCLHGTPPVVEGVAVVPRVDRVGRLAAMELVLSDMRGSNDKRVANERDDRKPPGRQANSQTMQNVAARSDAQQLALVLSVAYL